MLYGQLDDDNITRIARIHGEYSHIEDMMLEDAWAKEYDEYQKTRICYRCGDSLDDCCCESGSDH